MEPHKAISSDQGLNILNQVRSMCAVYPEDEEAVDAFAYSKTRYIRKHGWVSVERLENAYWQELEELVLEAYSRTAPKRLVQSLLNSERS